MEAQQHDQIDEQLDDYRAAQRRKFSSSHAVDSQGSIHNQDAAPSAPPMEESVPSAPPPPVQSSRKVEEEKNKKQMHDDEDLARRLQIQEEEERASTQERVLEQEIDYPALNDTSRDEQLARLLQEQDTNESPRIPSAPPAPSAPAQPQQQQEQGGFLATIGRGLRQAYDLYQQYSQQAQQDQISQDEELARQLQSQEMSAPVFQVRSPTMGHRGNYPNFYNYDEDMDDDDILTPQHPSEYENPLSRLREVNSVFRSMGTPPEHPLFQHLQELMNQSHPGNGPRIFISTNRMPTHRYAFPRPMLQHVRGVENLPPELYQMLQGQNDASYESLLQLAERLEPVSRGATSEQIEELPTRKFTEGSMPANEASCGVCLSDYEQGEELRTLPGCLHAFHKECIDKWLQINKVCPICRHEITADDSTTQ